MTEAERGGVPLRRPEDRRALDAAAERRAACPGGSSIRAAACRARARRTILRRSACSARRPATTVGDVMPCSGPLYERLWRPVLLAALNTEPAEADARLAAQILRETLGAGGQACRPMVATGGLSAAFIDPALALPRRARRARSASAIRCARSSSPTSAACGSISATRRSRSARTIASCSPCRRWSRARSFPGLTVPEDFPRHRQRAFPHRAAEKPAARSSA